MQGRRGNQPAENQQGPVEIKEQPRLAAEEAQHGVIARDQLR